MAIGQASLHNFCMAGCSDRFSLSNAAIAVLSSGDDGDGGQGFTVPIIEQANPNRTDSLAEILVSLRVNARTRCRVNPVRSAIMEL